MTKPMLRRAFIGVALTPVMLGAIAVGAESIVASGAAAGSSSQGAPTYATSTPIQAPAELASAMSAGSNGWTAEQMANAKPMPLGQRGNENGGPKPTVAPRTKSAQVTSAGQNTAGLPEDTSGASAPSATLTGADPQTTGTYPSPFSRWQWFGRYRTFPQSAAGVKIFFSQGSGNYVCSGSVVRPGVVDTAGHCTNSGGRGNSTSSPSTWSTNVQICPSYDADQGGVNPNVGCWGIQTEWTTTGWYSYGDFDNDFGEFVVAKTGGKCNCEIQQATGYLGYTYNASRDQHWIAEGYPQAAPFSGGKLITVAGEWWADQAGCGTEGCNYPPSVSQGNDMTGGSSGGPWIVNFGNGTYLNGHNDWKYTSSQPLSMQSPYYDDNWHNVLASACNSYTGTTNGC